MIFPKLAPLILCATGTLGFSLAAFISGIYPHRTIFFWVLPVIILGYAGYELINFYLPSIQRIKDYLAVGFANTGIDFFILNLLIITTHTSGGVWLGIFNFISFCAATMHSYFWMRSWVFRARDKQSLREFIYFWAVTALGGLLSSLILWGGVTVFHSIGIESLLALNGIKAVAVLLWIVWNFIGYQRFTFKAN